eukprot:364915-Chlamydomonas_euryale.AAC.29
MEADDNPHGRPLVEVRDAYATTKRARTASCRDVGRKLIRRAERAPIGPPVPASVACMSTPPGLPTGSPIQQESRAALQHTGVKA